MFKFAGKERNIAINHVDFLFSNLKGTAALRADEPDIQALIKPCTYLPLNLQMFSKPSLFNRRINKMQAKLN